MRFFKTTDLVVNKNMKNCVISVVGESSLHKEWIRGICDFDLHLVVYDDSYAEFVSDMSFTKKNIYWWILFRLTICLFVFCFLFLQSNYY